MKFCTNCGTKLSDDAMFCPDCGSKQDAPVATPNPQPYAQAPYAQQAQPYAQSPYTQQAQPVCGNAVPARKKSKLPLIIVGIVGAIVAVILLITVVLPLLGIGGKGYESAFDNLCEAVNEQDIDKLYKCMPLTYEVAAKGMIALGEMDEDELYYELFGYMGDDFEIDYYILDEEELSDYELSYYQDSIVGQKVKKGYEVEVEMSFSMDGYSYEEVSTVTVLKIGNRWCFEDFMF